MEVCLPRSQNQLESRIAATKSDDEDEGESSWSITTWQHLCPEIHIIADLFTVVCLVTWSLNESEAGSDLAIIEISLKGYRNQ